MVWCWPNGSTTQRPYIPPATGFYGPRAPIDTNGDGIPDTSSTHTGVDFTGLSTVYAVGPGEVTYVGYSGDAGYEVRVRHDGFTSRYYHLVKGSFLVEVGDRVNARTPTPTGTEGHSGLAKGDHLHLRFDTPLGRHFNPLPTLTELISAQGGGAGSGGAGSGGAPINSKRRLPMTARFIVAPGPLWAGIDLVAFRSQGGVIVTTSQATAENLSRVYPFPAEEVSREELNNSVIAARLWVDQVVNASVGGAVDFDEKALAAELAPLLRVDDDDLTEEDFRTYLEEKVAALRGDIAGVPAAVIVEQKKPGN
jgi:hypothetical protein